MLGADRGTARARPTCPWDMVDSSVDFSPAAAMVRQAQELTGVCFIQFDLVSGRRSASSNYQKVHGFPPKGDVSELLAHVHPADRAHFQAMDARMFSSPGRHIWTYRVVLDTGEVRWIEAVSDTLVDTRGCVTRVLVTCRNVSDAKLGPGDAISSIEQLRRVQHAALVGTWETDFVTGAEVWSAEAWALVEPGGIGSPTTERWLAAVHPDDRQQVLESFTTTMESGHYDDEYRVIHPDGSIHWHRGIATVEYDPAGKPLRMRGVVVDVTERRQAKDILARLATIIDALPYFVGWSDLDGRSVYLNPAGRSLLGIGQQENIVGMEIVRHLSPETRDRHAEIVKALISNGIWRGVIELVSRDGRTIPVASVRVLHRDAAGRPLYISTISRDISGERAARQAMIDMDRRKDEFIATLAHELRNPLAPIQSATDILKHMEASDPQLASVRRILQEQSGHLARLVDDLLDVARLARGKLSLQTAGISVEEAIRSAVRSCQGDIDERRHRLELQMPSTQALVEGDMVRLTQVFTNLIGNAVKFSEPGGRIAVELRQDAGAAVVTIVDEGDGIAAEFLPKMFDAFEQAADQRQTGRGGLGLGLMLVKQIVEMHRGSVTATSKGKGQGARFEVRLPTCAAASRSLDAGCTAAADALRAVGTRVMVVDDYAAIRDSLEMLLTMKGFVVETAADGQTVLARIGVFKPDVVLADMRMPRLGGNELARAIRALPGGSRIRLLAMSGNGTASDRQTALEAGFEELLVKPVDGARLVALLTAGRVDGRAVA